MSAALATHQVTYGHVFHDIAISGHARAIFGDVHVSCPDFMEHMTPMQRRRALLNALFYEDMHRRSAHIESARPKTCEWIWTTSFAKWLAEPVVDTLFWISGKAGSGKSTLMKYLAAAERVRSELPPAKSSDKDWAISHFFFDFRASKQLPNSEQGLLRTLLYQITSALPLDRDVLAKHELGLEHIISSQDADSLIDMLTDLVTSEKLSVLLFVDGLDEYEHSLHDLILLLQKIRERTGVRLCVASRPEAIIEAMIGRFPQVKVQNHNSTGIESYVRTTTDEVATSIDIGNHVSIEHFIQYILERAGGVFLWVHFAVNTLLEHLVIGCTEEEIQHELELLPTQLDKMYDRIFDQIPQICRPEACMILLLVETAPHVLTLQLLHRLWVYLHTVLGTGPAQYETFSLEQFQLRQRGFLGGLLDFEPATESDQFTPTINSGHVRVRLLHETLRAYMRKRSLISQWIDPAISQRFSDHIWLRIYTAVLTEANLAFGGQAWKVVEQVMQVYKVERVRQGYPWRAARAEFVRQIDIQKQSTVERSQGWSTSSLDVLPYAILHVDSVARSASIYSGALFEDYSAALQSPLTLTYDMMQSEIRQTGLPMKWRDPGWACDLAFAAARTWPAYLEVHRDRLANITSTERNYLLVCACGGSTNFAVAPMENNYRGSCTEDTAAVVSILLTFGPQYGVDNSHVAYLMQGQFLDHSPKFVAPLQHLIAQTPASPLESVVKVDFGQWRGMYPLSNNPPLDVIAMLAAQDSRVEVFELWLGIYKAAGWDFHTWQDTAGNNLLLCVLDSANCYIPTEETVTLRVLRRAIFLDDCGIHIPVTTSAGKCWMEHLRMLHRRVSSQSYSVLEAEIERQLSHRRVMKVDVASITNQRIADLVDELMQRAMKQVASALPTFQLSRAMDDLPETEYGVNEAAFTANARPTTPQDRARAGCQASNVERDLGPSTDTGPADSTSNLVILRMTYIRQEIASKQQAVQELTRQWVDLGMAGVISLKTDLENAHRAETCLRLELEALERGEIWAVDTPVPVEAALEPPKPRRPVSHGSFEQPRGTPNAPFGQRVDLQPAGYTQPLLENRDHVPEQRLSPSPSSRRLKVWGMLRSLRPKSIG